MFTSVMCCAVLKSGYSICIHETGVGAITDTIDAIVEIFVDCSLAVGHIDVGKDALQKQHAIDNLRIWTERVTREISAILGLIPMFQRIHDPSGVSGNS